MIRREADCARVRKRQGQRLRGVKNQELRRSTRIQEKQACKELAKTIPRSACLNVSQLPSPSSSESLKEKKLNRIPESKDCSKSGQKRKVESSVESGLPIPDERERKRRRVNENKVDQKSTAFFNRINHWAHEYRWPKRDFETDADMVGPAQKRSRSASLSSSRSLGTSQFYDHDPTMSDQRSREAKSSPYRSENYKILLELKNSYMRDSEAGILHSEKKDCMNLFNTEQPLPLNSLFDDSCFTNTYTSLEGENETRVIIDIMRLITPSAENLAAQGLEKLSCLKETTNAGWNESIPVEGPRPQPDYSVGFRFSTFSRGQLDKLSRSLKLGTKAYYAGTIKMYFPFLTTEVKCGQQAIDVADRQNAHSMTVAIRGLVELFRRVGRVQDIHRKILGFSISHNNEQVKIYAHYAEVDELSTKCYRYMLRNFTFVDNDGIERWTTYRFVRNIYDSFMPTHLERIKKAIDQLPEARTEPTTPALSVGGSISSQREGVTQSAPPSDKDVFKKPDLPPRRGSVANLRIQLERLLEERRVEKEEAKREAQQLLEERRVEKEEAKREAQQLMEERRVEKEEAKHEAQQLMEEKRVEREQLVEEKRAEREEAKKEREQLMAMLSEEREKGEQKHKEMMEMLRQFTTQRRETRE